MTGRHRAVFVHKNMNTDTISSNKAPFIMNPRIKNESDSLIIEEDSYITCRIHFFLGRIHKYVLADSFNLMNPPFVLTNVAQKKMNPSSYKRRIRLFLWRIHICHMADSCKMMNPPL